MNCTNVEQLYVLYSVPREINQILRMTLPAAGSTRNLECWNMRIT